MILERNTEVESCLTTKGEEDTVGLFTLDDIFDVFGCDREIVDFVGKDVGGLDGSDVGIYKD